jgi:hypothetical protein
LPLWNVPAHPQSHPSRRRLANPEGISVFQKTRHLR